RPQLVVLGSAKVLRARQDLERPEAQEQHAEDDDRKGAEDPDRKREPRGQWVGLLDARIRGEEAVRRRAASQRDAPPARCERRRAAGTAFVPAHRPEW